MSTATVAERVRPQVAKSSKQVVPKIPESIADTGLPESMIEQLILKTLYFRSETVGRDLALSLGLKFSVIEGMVDFLKRQRQIVVRRSMGVGTVSSVYALTDSGRALARDYLEANQYAGKAPVPLDQYVAIIRQQKWNESWLNMEMLQQSFEHMVVSPRILTQLGPAINSGKSFLIYGNPGNGKTYLAEALFHLDVGPVYIPYAIECQGMIIQMYDPVYHRPLPQEGDDPGALAWEPKHDTRWFWSLRPFIMSGGELTLDALDLSYNPVSKFYDAPLHLKANNGIYLIDDFGRQRATPAEVLNRWIVPMERRVDYLRFQNGSKMNIPFETFLIFSTNLKPGDLGDEAFLRRIQYKMLLRNPEEDEFIEIFRRAADDHRLDYDQSMLDRFIEKHYRSGERQRRRCHPRDVLNHAVDIIRFERRPWELNDEILDHAFETCFMEDAED